mgnify:CR=1 FL=1
MASSKTLWKLTAGALLSLAAQPALPSHPSHLVEGIRAYENGQFKQAYSVFASHADTTNPKALYYLSALYLSGKGVDQDEDDVAIGIDGPRGRGCPQPEGRGEDDHETGERPAHGRGPRQHHGQRTHRRDVARGGIQQVNAGRVAAAA